MIAYPGIVVSATNRNREVAVRKTVLFYTLSMVLMCNSAYPGGPAQKPAVDKKEEAKQMVIKGTQSFSAQRYDEAITWYKQAIALDPDSVDANYNLGVAFGNKGLLDESMAAYNRVIVINPLHAQAHNNLGSAFEKKGMADKAHFEYEKAVSADPDLAPALYNLGKSFLSRDDKNQAADYLYKAGMLFHRSGDKKWAQKSCDLLTQTNSPTLETKLYEMVYAVANGHDKELISK